MLILPSYAAPQVCREMVLSEVDALVSNVALVDYRVVMDEVALADKL